MVNRKKNGKWKSAAARRLLEMAGNPTTVEEAARIVATEALRGIPHPPLDIDAFAEKLNVGPVLYEDVPFSGELRPTPEGFVVVCSKHMSLSRQRFTIAHELSHAILERSGPRCPRKGPELERICDMLATELLMPRSVFFERAGDGAAIDRIFDLARTFGTSISATAIRFAELLNVSVFQVEKGMVVWGYGLVTKGPTMLIDSDLQRLAGYGIAGGNGSANVRLLAHGLSRPWCVEYRAMNGSRALFLLRPERKTATAKAS
jgi:hypothetical protein